MTTSELIKNAMSLPRHSRAILAELLLDTLDEGATSAYDDEWLAVAKSRKAELLAGKVDGIPHNQAMDEIRKQTTSTQ